MAVRKFTLCIGQSNGAPVGDAQGWEEANLEVAIRNPQSTSSVLPLSSVGAYTDSWTLSNTFPYGPQVGLLGDETNGKWQTVSTRGLAIQAIRYLTFYSPIPQFVTFDGYTSCYPGMARVASGSAPQRIVVDRMSESVKLTNTAAFASGADPTITCTAHGLAVNDLVAFGGSGTATIGIDPKSTFQVKSTPTADTFKVTLWPEATDITNESGGAVGSITVYKADQGTITRRMTGTTHRAGCGWTGSGATAVGKYLLNLDPPFNPEPQAGELIEFPVIAAVDSAADDELTFRHRLGGTHDTGDADALPCYLRQPDGDYPMVLTVPSGPIYYNKPIQFTSATLGGGGQFFTYSGSGNNLTLASHGFQTGDYVLLTQVGVLPTGLTNGAYYYVTVVDSNTFTLSTTRYGSAVTISGAGTPPNIIQGAVPVELSGVTFYTGRRAVVDESFFLVIGSSTVNTGTGVLTFAADHKLLNGERVKVTVVGTAPGGLVSDQHYYVRLTGTANTVRLCESKNSSPITSFTSLGDGALVITRTEHFCHYHVSETPGGREIKEFCAEQTTDLLVQRTSSFNGALTGVQVTCESGTAANVGITRTCGYVEYDLSNDRSILHVDTAWPDTPSAGDTFTFSAPAAGEETRSFEQWAEFLPWCPFEGGGLPSAGFAASPLYFVGGDPPYIVASTESADLVPGSRVRFYADEKLISPMVCGKDYYVHTIAGGAIYFSATYGGDPVQARYATVASVSSSLVTVTEGHKFANLEPIAFFGEDCAAIGVTQAAVYYVVKDSETTFSIATGSDGSGGVTLTDLASPTDLRVSMATVGAMVSSIAEQDGRFNPYPPGFNYPNHHDAMPLFQPFRAPAIMAKVPRIGHTVGTNLLIHQSIGEPVYVVSLAIGGTSIGHKEVSPAAFNPGIGWFDQNQQLSWAPGENDNIWARLEDVVAAARMAAAKDGDTLECLGVFFAQGEEDARIERFSQRYESNLRRFKKAVRDLLVSEGLYSGAAETIPWVQPKIKELWDYSEAVNAAIEALVEEDPYMRTCEVEDFDVMPDGVHYTGASMATFNGRLFDAWYDIQSSGTQVVDVCNLALAHIGDKATVTSISPPDGSAQAELCARYYPIARDIMLEAYPWDFALRTRQLVATTTTRTDWEFAYLLPSDMATAIAVLPDEFSDDQSDGLSDPARRARYAIEMGPHGSRVLLCNVENAWLRYSARVTDSTRWSQQFVVALSWQLASYLAGPIIKGDVGMKVAQQATQMARYYTGLARDTDAQSTRIKKPMDTHKPSWLRGFIGP